MRQWAIWALNIALFVAGCFLMARIGVAILAEVALPTRAEMAPVAVQSADANPTWQQRKVILERNLFGAKVEGPQGENEQPIVDVEETKLPLRLLGTVAGQDQNLSNAAIQEVGGRDHQVVFVGDTLENHDGVRVHRIYRGRVLLDNRGKREELKLSEDDNTKPRRGRRRNARRARRAARTPLAKRVEDMQANPGGRSTAKLYSQARIVPQWEDGAMVGVQLNQIKDGSLYDKLGLENGVVITSLNGVAIDSPQASTKLLTEFTSAGEFKIETKSGQTIEVGAKELDTLMAENEDG